jgi:hypothetical protein
MLSTPRFAAVVAIGTVLVASVAACSSSSSTSGGDGGTTTTQGGTGGNCEARQAKLSGSIDGTSVDQTYSSSGYALVLKDFSGLIGTRGNVTFVLSQNGVSSGGTPIVWGTLKMPTEGPFARETFCVGGGTLLRGDSSYGFTLTGLSRAPAGGDAGACPGTAVSGEISGCVGGR